MQLTKQESSAAFWHGAKQGAWRSLGYVAATGAVLGLLLVTGILPTAMFTLGTAVLTGISTVFTVGMFSGHNALAQYHQQKHNRIYEAKLAQLEGRDAELGHDDLQHSPALTTILEEGSKAASGSFADAETQRAAAKPKTPTIH